MLSFVGTKFDVYPLLQTLSHTARAYIFNEKGLKGFLEKGSFTSFVLSHDRSNTLDTVSGNVKVDVEKLLHGRSVEEQLKFAKRTLPSLYISYMRYIRKDEKIEECMKVFKNYRDDPKYFHLYI